jgi:hypothetical protein
MLKLLKFIDSRTGEIVTTIRLSEITYFDKYSGTREVGEFDSLIAGRQQAAEIMQAAEQRITNHD